MHHAYRVVHTTVFVTTVVEHWLEEEVAQWVDREDLFNQLDIIMSGIGIYMY